MDVRDRAIVLATQAGLPLVPDPWGAVGRMTGMSGDEVLARMQAMAARGVIRRVAAVPNHYRLGYVANGMTVWDVDDAEIDRLGREIAAIEGVSHCYRRPRHRPHWPFNLFAMLHGRSREEVERQAEVLRARLGEACREHRILYSSRILKKTGLRLGPGGAGSDTPQRR
ncbi:Lrp/AsnC family transcriptional regulator [Halomonas nitroreducens]|uniref:siroheme decarboxylase n=1 Tax=Halomonas nitroreducens TaxID=447425 RepID=A0A431V3R4_9GAMM|nr:Lrp/AsnC family transcriptional regulator [Halomonas nitroreducens]